MWPSRTCSQVAVWRFQTRTVVSSEALSARVPSGCTATAFTPPVWPSRTCSQVAVWRFQTRTVSSSEALSARVPSGCTATLRTVSVCPSEIVRDRGRVAVAVGLPGGRRRRGLGPAGEHELLELAVAATAPVDREELRERSGRGRVVEAQGDEAAVAVERVAEAEGLALDRGPVGAERVLGHAQHEHRRALEAVLDPARRSSRLAGAPSRRARRAGRGRAGGPPNPRRRACRASCSSGTRRA